MFVRRTPRPLARAGRAALLSALACSSPDAGTVTDPPDAPDPDPPEEEGTLECEIRDYPCSQSEVSIEVLERGDALGDEAVGMIDAGSSTAQVAAWLDSQPDMAEVQWDPLAVRFRLEGGRAIWIFTEGVFGTSGAGVAQRAVRSPTVSATASARVVVGPEQKEKKALVLSPFLWEMGEFDDGAAVAAILAGTRGYEGGVTYLANAEQTSSAVGVQSFAGWGAYQVVHVSTHGKRLCDDDGCRATIVAGLLEAALPPGSGTKADKLKALEEVGVDVVKSSRNGREYLVLGADFFQKQYGQGLDNAIVFINSCQSLGSQATDLGDAIQGTTSVVFGWDEAVYAADATAASLALYEQLSEYGYPAEIAHAKIGDLKTGEGVRGGPSPTLRLSRRPAGGDLRIRDIIYLLHPTSAQILQAGGRVSIEGTQGDGQADAVPWLVRVDGVLPEFAANMVVHVSIDGKEAQPVAVGSGTANDKDQWTVGGMVDLGYDLESERGATFQASVNLHSGGESEHEEVGTLIGEEPIMGTEWEFVAEEENGWVGVPNTPWKASARLTLRFAPDQRPDEPNPRYMVTGGTVTYDYNHTYFDCTYSAPVLTYDVTEEHTGTSFLTFDTETEPVGYGGVIYTQGPTIVVTTDCGDGPSTRSDVAANTWMLLDPGEFEAVSADRRTITGTYRREQHFTGYYYYRDSKYTITRIQ